MRNHINVETRFGATARSALFMLCASLLLSTTAVAQTWGPVFWADEFNGAVNTQIDPKNWTYDTGILQVNNEVEFYCSPTMATNGCQLGNPNAYIDGNGNLVIQAIRQNTSTTPNSGSWTSARLKTEGLQPFQYGRIESRMSLPVGQGIWPAFWALGTNIDGTGSVGWPACGESDFMENVPSLGISKIASTLHGTDTTVSSRVYGLGGQYTFPTGDVTGMHVYGTIWSPGMVQYYVDDSTKPFFVGTASDMKSGQTWAFDHPFFLLLNLAIGGDGSWPGPTDATTPNPAVMTVDYVRVYKAIATQPPTFGTPPTITIKAGATSGNSSSFTLGNAAGTGRVYLTCATNAPKASCQVHTGDSLNAYTVDFTNATSGSVTVSVTTTANAMVIPPVAWRWRMQSWRGVFGLIAAVLVLVVLRRMLRQMRWAPAAGIGVLLFLAVLVGCAGGGSGSGSNPPPPGGGTTPGSYTITVNAYTVSGNGTNPDASTTIPLTVN